MFPIQDEEDSFVMKAIIHAINDDNVPGLKHLLGSLTSYDINHPNKVRDPNRGSNKKARKYGRKMSKPSRFLWNPVQECLLGFIPIRTAAKASSIDQLISVSFTLVMTLESPGSFHGRLFKAVLMFSASAYENTS